MLKKYLLLLFAAPIIAYSQDKDEELINWKSSRQLTWSDYKGTPNSRSDAAASTTTYLGIDFNIDEKGLSYRIQCRFSKTKSWGRSKTEFILQHEQGHFDIAEIFARKLKKRMTEYQFNANTYNDDLKNIYQEITQQKEVFQDQYDKETDHSRKKDEQLAWTKKIAQMLEELKSFSDYS